MAEAPGEDEDEETLTPDNAIDVYEELLPALSHSYVLGLKLKLPQHVVEAIHNLKIPPQQYLLKVIEDFTKQDEPRPTRKMIVEALRSPAIRMTALAKSVEESRVSKPTRPRYAVPIKCAANLGQITSEVVSKNIKDLEEKFSSLKENIKECLKKRRVLVEKVADVLTSISADEDEQHKMFLKSNVKELFGASDIPELFGTMNFHWNYLNPPLLDHLVQSFNLDEVKGKMRSYKLDLQKFLHQTPLALFYRTQTRRKLLLTPEFRELVAEFNWPKDMLLEIVEQFRKEYASKYNLRDCAMMVSHVRAGSFIITWIIPSSIVAILKSRAVRDLLRKYHITRLEVDRVCIYRLRKAQGSLSSSSGGLVTIDATEPNTPRVSTQPQTFLEEEYPFVEQPPEDFFCPVTFNLLRQPHLTLCCGHHLSQEAVTKIQENKGPCPICKEKNWSSVLNKHIQRKVNSIPVFCCHDDKGCEWQGELVDFHDHLESCHKPGVIHNTDPTRNETVVSGATAVASDEKSILPKVVVRPTGRMLGRGSYGDVLEVAYAGKLFAAKKYRSYYRSEHQFGLESDILVRLRHPNIVPYYGVCRLPDSSVVLVMQRLEMNLSAYLTEEKTLHRKQDILLDIAEGLDYLHKHKPVIIHRDLTASNVLIAKNGVAKIADFGKSKLVNIDATPELLTTNPGTLDYMAPEGLEGMYNEKLDIFSFGHLTIYTLLQQRPHPLRRPMYKQNGKLFVRTEVERRVDYLKKIETRYGDQHPLYILIIRCLQDEPQLRPSCDKIISILSKNM